MKLIIIGSPGAGKGTQAKRLAKHFDIAHISTGAMLRNEMRNRTEIGLRVADTMNAGRLVPDEIVTALLAERIQASDCRNGFILDGYPRNAAQAKTSFDVVGNIDRVIDIIAEDTAIIERMSGRRVCPSCGCMYHTKYTPPKADGVCDECGASLIQRDDDKEETVKERLKIYHEATAPIIDYYSSMGIIMHIDGMQDIDRISELLISELEKYRSEKL